jgi:hypothetical protein
METQDDVKIPSILIHPPFFPMQLLEEKPRRRMRKEKALSHQTREGKRLRALSTEQERIRASSM